MIKNILQIYNHRFIYLLIYIISINIHYTTDRVSCRSARISVTYHVSFIIYILLFLFLGNIPVILQQTLIKTLFFLYGRGRTINCQQSAIMRPIIIF